MSSGQTEARARLEPLSGRTLHVVIDMQRLFAEPTDWHTPALAGILPAVTRLAEARDTLFVRFVPAQNPAAAEGRWRRYYERWAGVTGERLGREMLDLVAPLAAIARTGRIVDKTTYSAFGSLAFLRIVEEGGFDTLVLTGVETDVCILATLLDAVDRGYRVVVPADAVASASPAAHQAVLEHVLTRLPEQVDISDVSQVLSAGGGERVIS